MNYWTEDPARKEQALKWWTEGWSATEISKSLPSSQLFPKPSRNAVIGIVHRTGNARPKSQKPTVVTHRPKPAAKPAKPRAIAPPPPPPPSRQQAPLERIPNGEEGWGAVPASRQCKWPIGDPQDPDFHFCTAQRPLEKSYCAEHAGVAFQPPSNRKGDRAKDLVRSLRRFIA